MLVISSQCVCVCVCVYVWGGGVLEFCSMMHLSIFTSYKNLISTVFFLVDEIILLDKMDELKVNNISKQKKIKNSKKGKTNQENEARASTVEIENRLTNKVMS